MCGRGLRPGGAIYRLEAKGMSSRRRRDSRAGDNKAINPNPAELLNKAVIALGLPASTK